MRQKNDAFLTADEAARMIGTTTRTLRRWRLDGYGPVWGRLSFPRGRIVYPKKRLKMWLGTDQRAA